MLDISLNDFLKMRDVRFVNIPDEKFKSRHIKGISIDSRMLEPDQVYWAIKGERYDGHDFVSEAQSKGALCSIISEKYFSNFADLELPLIVVPDTLLALQQLAHIQRLKYDIPVIALTGSNGKTTTKEMIAAILQTRKNVHKTKGNQNNQIGCPLTMLLLTEMHEAAVLELGTNQFGEIEVLSQMVEPSHALITLIGDTHLELLGSREGVAKEKFKLFDNLSDGSTVYKNLDDPIIAGYDRDTLKYITYSFKKDADVKGAYGPIDENGCGQLRVNDSFDIQLKVPGIHNVRNALAAVTVALDMGFGPKEISAALENYIGFEKRMQIIKWKEITIVNDAYNANPASMKLAIDTVLKIKHTGKVILALGDMNELGEKSAEMHKDLLKYAMDSGADLIFSLGDKINSARKSFSAGQIDKIQKCKSLNDLAAKLGETVHSGDILLLKGSRSMQMEKVMAYLP
jgi:UDP-N-acetylmuramoyl-tripeptide--D-alanyl-D-alanine ligase